MLDPFSHPEKEPLWKGQVPTFITPPPVSVLFREATHLPAARFVRFSCYLLSSLTSIPSTSIWARTPNFWPMRRSFGTQYSNRSLNWPKKRSHIHFSEVIWSRRPLLGLFLPLSWLRLSRNMGKFLPHPLTRIRYRSCVVPFLAESFRMCPSLMSSLVGFTMSSSPPSSSYTFSNECILS